MKITIFNDDENKTTDKVENNNDDKVPEDNETNTDNDMTNSTLDKAPTNSEEYRKAGKEKYSKASSLCPCKHNSSLYTVLTSEWWENSQQRSFIGEKISKV